MNLTVDFWLYSTFGYLYSRKENIIITEKRNCRTQIDFGGLDRKDSWKI